MKIISTVGYAMLLVVLSSAGGSSSIMHDRLNDTDLTAEDKGERSAVPGLTPRLLLVKDLVRGVTGLSETAVLGVYNYGCWCGPRGQGKVVDNFDYCCKVHDFCENELQDSDKCGGNLDNMNRNFKYDANTYRCSPLSEYRSRDVERNKCRHAVCICDMEMVRCMKHYKDTFSSDNVGWVTSHHKSCAITGGDFCKTKADVVVLIQDSQGISTTTVGNIKTVVRRLLTLLSSESTAFTFALATYAKSRRISCFGSATDTISYMDREYNHGGRGTKNLLKRALSRMILKQFQNRRDDRKGDDTAKILVIFSDGKAEHGRGASGNIMDTFRLEKAAKLLRDNNKVKIVGALIPNSDNTQRIQELKGIVTEPNDAIDEDFTSSNLNNIADLLAARVKRFVSCPVTYTVEVFTEETFVNNEYDLEVRIEGQGDKQTEDHALTEPTTEMQGNLFVIKTEFSDLDVGTVRRVHLSASRKIQGNNEWTLKKVKVKKGGETVIAVFNEDIPAWPLGQWYSARARASNPPSGS